ncbi:MAG TPA: response regulator, partial [Armatimonadota bacterium]
MESQNPLPRLLVIDDEPGICLAVALLLQDQFDAVMAETVEEVRQRLAEPFALILLDLRMPGVNGYDLLDMIRATVPRTPVAVLTAMGDRRTMDDILQHGAVALIEKPFSRQELLSHIAEILGPPTS